MNEIRNQFRKISNLITAKADVVAGTGHPSTTGKLRELIVHNLLKPHLPRTLEIKSGIIIDSEGIKSKQQDCIIIDARLPMLDVGSEQESIIIAEAVVATIEIKSYLNEHEIQNTIKSIEITKKLKRIGQQIYSKGGKICQISSPLPILTYIFSFDSISLESIVSSYSDIAFKNGNSSIIPEATCILNKGVLLRSSSHPIICGNTITLPPLKEAKLTAQEFKKDSLFAFYRRLIDDVMTLRIENYDIDKYYSTNELE